MADESDLDKTESATPKRIAQAREDGQVARSRELTTFVLLMAGFGGSYAMAGSLADAFVNVFRGAFTFDRALSFDTALVLPNAGQLFARGAMAILPLSFSSALASATRLDW